MKRVLFLSLAVFLYGCTLYQIDSIEIADHVYPPKVSTKDVVYLENVSRPHEIIGQVKVNAERRQRMEVVIEKLKYEAAMIGADAVTNISANAGEGRWARGKPKTLFGNSNIRANFVADAVIFK